MQILSKSKTRNGTGNTPFFHAINSHSPFFQTAYLKLWRCLPTVRRRLDFSTRESTAPYSGFLNL